MNKGLYTEIDGFSIAYHRQGSGTPMILVHGITTYSFIWQKMVPGLSRHYDVIAIDLLGCGDSDKPPGTDYSLPAQARIIRKFIDNLALNQVHVICHDVGGGIGQILSVKYPEVIKDLVLINTVGYDYWPVQPIITMRIPVIRQLAMAALDFGMLKMLVRRGFHHKERLTDELMDQFSSPLSNKEGRQAFLQFAKSLNNRNLTEIEKSIGKISFPVLIVRGDADPYLSADISERLHREIRESQLIRIPTGGHFLQEDEPDMLVEMIHTFIGKTKK